MSWIEIAGEVLEIVRTARKVLTVFEEVLDTVTGDHDGSSEEKVVDIG